MYCDRCGVQNRDGATFCRSCGAVLGPAEDVVETRELPGPPKVPDALRAAVAGRYEIERLLGRGGMGEVYLAREVMLDRLVAIKVLERDARREESVVKRFVQEARIAAKLRHPGIVAIHDIGSSGEIHYFTMDYVPGPTLDDLVSREGPLPAERARAILASVAAAVQHAHRAGVIHRDLKPANVLVDLDGHVFVSDFGLAKNVDGQGITTSGIIVGTPQYLSPERLEGRPATPASDVYALGLLYAFLLTGHHVVTGDSLSSIVGQHMSGTPRSRVQADPALPEPARSLIVAMLDRDPAHRPTSLDDVLARLGSGAPASLSTERILAAPSPAPDSAPAPPPPLSPVRREARARLQNLLDRMPKKPRS
ncbi:MAG: serine/threonine-protein kinase [Acidobacteriota bacterium]